MIPLTLSPHIEFSRKEKAKEEPASTTGVSDLQFTLVIIALVLVSCAVLALSGALIVHAAKA